MTAKKYWITKTFQTFFFKKGAYPASFSLFSSFQYTVASKQMININKKLPVTGFEQQTSGIWSDHSTNWANTTATTFQALRWISKLREAALLKIIQQ